MKIVWERVEEHRWIKKESLPEWVRRRYYVGRDVEEVLLSFRALRGSGDVFTIGVWVKTEELDWYPTSNLSKDILTKYVEFLREQIEA